MTEVILKRKFTVPSQSRTELLKAEFGDEFMETHKILELGKTLYPSMFHGVSGGAMNYSWDAIKTGEKTWVGTYSDVDHSDKLMDRNGVVIKENFDENGQTFGLTVGIPRIAKNKDFIDMADAKLIDEVSVSMYVTPGTDKSLIEELGGDYAESITGNGVGFVTEGAVDGACITKILNKANNKVYKMTEDTALLKEKDDLLEKLEDNYSELSGKDENIADLQKQVEEYRKADEERSEAEIAKLRLEVVEKTDIPEEKAATMGKETLEAFLEFTPKSDPDPTRETVSEGSSTESVETKSKNPLTYNRMLGGLVEFYSERPSYIPDHVAGQTRRTE